MQRFPIICFPAGGQVFCLSIGEARVVKDKPGFGALFLEFEFGNRIHARVPSHHAPGLNDAFIGHKLDLSPNDVPAETGKRATDFTADVRGRGSRGRAGLHGRTELRYLIELFGVGERFIDALPARFENNFLVNGFARV